MNAIFTPFDIVFSQFVAKLHFFDLFFSKMNAKLTNHERINNKYR